MEFKKGIAKRKKFFNEWNSLLSEIEKHNKDLNYLHSEFDNFSFDNIIKNPASITADIIEIYSKNISILNQYKHKLKRLVFYFETSLFFIQLLLSNPSNYI